MGPKLRGLITLLDVVSTSYGADNASFAIRYVILHSTKYGKHSSLAIFSNILIVYFLHHSRPELRMAN
jgi:hypothetical protein